MIFSVIRSQVEKAWEFMHFDLVKISPLICDNFDSKNLREFLVSKAIQCIPSNALL